MASELRVNTIYDKNGDNSSSAEEIKLGRAKAWVNFDGTFGTSPFTIANGGIRDAFNVSSVTDNGTGQYTVNFSNALPDTNYAAVITSYYTDVSGQAGYIAFEDGRLTARTSGSFTLATATPSVYNDSAITSVVIFR